MRPRFEMDPRLDWHELRDPPRAAEHVSPRRAPLWIAIDASMLRREPEGASFGAMLLLGLPLERLAMRGTSITEGPRAPKDAPPPALKPPPGTKPEVPPAQAKLPPAPPSAIPPPLRVPVEITPEAARDAVEAALRRAKLADADARFDALARRARGAAALPELRLRVVRTVDQGQTLSPTEYDPQRTTASGGSSLWLEARATWRLDRLVFADEEVALERMRHERAEARARLTAQVLRVLFEWQRALALADNPAGSPEENLAARLKALEAAAELDLLTGGWLTKWRETKAGS